MRCLGLVFILPPGAVLEALPEDLHNKDGRWGVQVVKTQGQSEGGAIHGCIILICYLAAHKI